ncbi:MAG: hypothetical protein HZB34_16200 [Nitrospirae bacterium]|jgi:uncharacterized membrane protein|nr:hypothetical protein [Nitrospirota bacterium]
MRRMSRWGMICCLTLEWLALGIWVGGLLVLIGAVIPAVFNTFGGQDIGGLFLTQAFEGYNRFVIGAVTILCAAAWYRWWSGDQAVAVSRGELALLAGMVLIAGIIVVVLHPYASSLQAQAFAVKEEAARKAAFEALFRVLLPVRLIYMVNLAMGILLIGIRSSLSLSREKIST